MAFSGMILTTKGKVLQAKVQAGTTMVFTKIKVGDGVLATGETLEALSDLIGPQLNIAIQNVTSLGDGTCRIRSVLTNTGLTAGFFVREIGVFANDPEAGEVLYAVANAGNECDYLPAAGGATAIEQVIDIITAVGNSVNITAVINHSAVLATMQDIKNDQLALLESTGYGVISGCEILAQDTPDMTIKFGTLETNRVHMPSGNLYTLSYVSSLAIMPSDPSLARIDRVYINSCGQVAYAQGTAAVSSVAPELPDGSVKVYRVSVAAGATAITNADLTDERLTKNYILAGDIAPVNPSPNTIWLNSTNNTVQRFDGSSWQPFNVLNIVDVRTLGAKGNGIIDDTSAVQTAINRIGSSGIVFFPLGTYNVSTLIVTKPNVTLLGYNMGTQYGNAVIKGIQDGVSIIDSRSSQLCLNGVSVWGLSDITEQGENITQTGIKFSNPTNENNIDAVIMNSGFIYLKHCIEQNGRNIRVANTLFSNSQKVVYIPNSGVVDIRGLELYGNRYHSIGKSGSTNSAVVWANPLANFFEVTITGGEADDCNSVFYGFAGMVNINGMTVSKLRDQFVNIDNTGTGLAQDRRNVKISNNQIHHYAPTTVSSSMMKFTGSGSYYNLECTGNQIASSGGHGIEINVPYFKLTSNKVDNAGMYADNTYSCYFLGANALGGFISDNYAGQDRIGSATNKAKYAFENHGADNVFGINHLSNFAGKEYYIDPAIKSYGFDPVNIPRRIMYGTASPTSGTYNRGDIMNNLAPSAGGYTGWVCVTSGSPGIWKGFGLIAS